MRHLAVLLLIAVAFPALAQDVPAPLPRPDSVPSGETEATPVPLPRQRPDPGSAIEEPGVHEESMPPAEPRVYQAACPAVLAGKVEAEALQPIANGACGERSPLSVTAILVHGRMVPLSGEAIVTCGMASTLPE